MLEDENLWSKVIEDIGAYFMDELWQDLNNDEQHALGILAVFRIPLTVQDIQKLVPKKEALIKLRGYSLLQLEGEGRSYVVHPVVSEYVLAKIGTEESKQIHKKASDFYIHQHDDLLKSMPEAEPLKVLCAVMEMLAKRGMREQTDAMASSLLEIHHHLFEAGEYKQAGAIVTAMVPFLNMQGLRDLAKELLKKSIDSLEGFSRYVAMGNLATLLNYEGKWQEALDTHQECLEFFRSVDAKPQTETVISQQALIYQQQGKYEQAFNLEQESLALEEEIGDKEGIVVSHYRIAQLLHRMGRYDEALEQGKEGLKLAQELENQRFEAAFLHQLGMTLNKLNRPKEAFKHSSRSLAIWECINDQEGQADSLIEIGRLLLGARRFNEALNRF